MDGSAYHSFDGLRDAPFSSLMQPHARLSQPLVLASTCCCSRCEGDIFCAFHALFIVVGNLRCGGPAGDAVAGGGRQVPGGSYET